MDVATIPELLETMVAKFASVATWRVYDVAPLELLHVIATGFATPVDPSSGDTSVGAGGGGTTGAVLKLHGEDHALVRTSVSARTRQ